MRRLKAAATADVVSAAAAAAAAATTARAMTGAGTAAAAAAVTLPRKQARWSHRLTSELEEWRVLLCAAPPPLRRALAAGVGLGIAQQASGTEAALYYSAPLLAAAGLTSLPQVLVANIGVGTCKVSSQRVPREFPESSPIEFL